MPPLPPPPPHFQGNVKATQKSKARAMPVTRNWSKLCLPCGHYFALSSRDSLSCCLQKRLKHLQIHTMGELLVSEVDEYWEKPGKSPLAIHWNPTASEERWHETALFCNFWSLCMVREKYLHIFNVNIQDISSICILFKTFKREKNAQDSRFLKIESQRLVFKLLITCFDVYKGRF